MGVPPSGEGRVLEGRALPEKPGKVRGGCPEQCLLQNPLCAGCTMQSVFSCEATVPDVGVAYRILTVDRAVGALIIVPIFIEQESEAQRG